MLVTESQASVGRPAGYAALVADLGVVVMPIRHTSLIAAGNTHRIETADGMVRETYPARYWPGDDVGSHLEFAIKHDGVNPAILACVFRAADPNEITAYIASKPTGKYARRVWYLYELITGKRLPLDDLTRSNYVDLLEPDAYITSPAVQVRRQRINDNMLGTARFCPIVRRTEAIDRWMHVDLMQRCRQVLRDYPPELLKRALSYLYTKETKSSFEIEQITPDAGRTERFISLLQLAEKEDFCDRQHLVDLQNRIVDSRFADRDYRNNQNYIGETVGPHHERVHYVCPKPEDLPDLMSGLIDTHQRMEQGGQVHPVVHAAAVAYGFVFLHPFEDGNGRIHRFLIHNILARSGYTPEGLMFPVSAIMLKNPLDYDASLEAFSRPLLPVTEFTLDDQGRMTVHNATADWYRFIDMTAQVEALFGFIEQTIDTELASGLSFLVNYDRAKAAIQDIVDMPDRLIDLFIRLCLQNHGKLSIGKRANHFAALTAEEVSRMERAVGEAYGQIL